ncbi:MAG: acyl--CoA ligase [Mollicutes bacterium]|nr:acyl--CoA ligase [Mollicutes bacterium]
MARNKTGYPHIDQPWQQYYDQSIINVPDKNINITRYLKNKTKGNDNLIASEYYGHSKNYRQFWHDVDLASNAFTGLGLNPEERIKFLVPNIPQAGEMWLGAAQIGAVSNFSDPRPDSMIPEVNAKKMLQLLESEKVKHIVALEQCYLGMLQPIENELKELGIDRIVTVSASKEMNLLQKIDYLKEALAYNKIENNRKDENIEKLRFYQVILNKIREANKLTRLYEDAIKKSPLEIVTYQQVLNNTTSFRYNEIIIGDLINYIGHTSGTTGSRPKPIPLTSRNQISSIEQLFKAKANFKKGDRVLHILPFFAPFGAFNNYALNIASNAINIEVPEFKINEFGYLIKKYHPNVILSTPSWLLALTKCKYLDNMDLSFINRIIYGGDSMTSADEAKMNAWLKEHNCNKRIEKGHGMSEFCGCGSYAQREYNIYGSIGIPLPNTIYSIVDPNVEDRLVPLKFEKEMDRLAGELVVSSDAVTEGVLDGKIIIPHYQMDGRSYIRSRDLAEMDRNGVFYFNERKGRAFSRFDGFNVITYEIEKAIEEHPLVKYCVIVPYYDVERRGNMPKAHIVLEDENYDIDYYEVTKRIINEQIIQNPDMSSRQIPSRIEYKKELPFTKNSKVDYLNLIKQGISNNDVLVKVSETNISIGAVQIVVPEEMQKTKVLKRVV